MISSPDARVVASWSSCLESFKKFLLDLPLEHDGSVWKKASCQDNPEGMPAAAAKRKKKASNPPPKGVKGEIRHGQQQHSNLRGSVRHEFLRAILGHVGGGDSLGSSGASFSDPERLPSLDAAYLDFLRIFPRFAESLGVDEMRAREYAHLNHRVCLDYSGFGLFSHLQRVCDARSSSFRLAYVAASLPAHALYGAPAASVEAYIRRKIMDHFRICDSDYFMVFTASKGSAIRLLAESYQFGHHGRLLTAYDHCSQSIEWMIELAREKGAKVSSVSFRWPSLRICSRDLRRQLIEKKKRRDSSSAIKGLFVFPLQSRVTGARYSHQWIPFAQEQHWHVLLDASALGPRDMDALGLSVFRPDFIVASFYKVFGADPSGFGCLFIKRSAIKSLSSSSRARSVGMVKLLPCSLHQAHEQEIRENGRNHEQYVDNSDVDPSNVSSFSGPLSGEDIIVRDDKHATRDPFDRAIISTTREDDGDQDKIELADPISQENTQGGDDPSTSTVLERESPPCSLLDIKGKRKVVEESEAAESSLANEMRWAESLQRKKEISSRVPVNTVERLNNAAAPAPRAAQTLAQLLHLPEPIEDSEATRPAPAKTLKELIVVPEVCELPPASFREDDDADKDKDDQERVVCLALDQTKILGMINITNRLRYLVSWLVLSLIKLRHPASSHGSFKPPLVQIYGPSERKYNRGTSMAFNLYDWDGLLFQPTLVQRLADRNSISLGLAQIKNVKFAEFVPDIQNISSRKSSSNAAAHESSSGGCQDFVVVTIALSYVSSFEDVYRVWGFVAKFLDADFVNKEVWRYHSLNQKVVVLEGDLSPYHTIP